MKDKTQPEALRLANEFKLCNEYDSIPSMNDIAKAEAELRRQHARIAELEADHFEDKLDMVARWYMVDKDGMATLCTDREDAEQEAKDANMAWPSMAPHRVVQLVEAGRASLSANAGEPRALNPRHIRKFLQALQAGEMSVSRAVEILDAWVGGYYEDEMVPPPPPDSCLIADDEFPMEIVRKLRSELAAAPPTAQAEGWRPISTAPKDGALIVLGARNGVWLGKYLPVYQSGYRPENPWSSMLLNHDHMAERYTRPTHWMPLPPLPTSAEGVEHG